MPKAKPKSQILDYVVLIIILTIGSVACIMSKHQISSQMIIVGITSISYVLWGAWHHTRLKEPLRDIILEYILVAALALTLILSNLLLL